MLTEKATQSSQSSANLETSHLPTHLTPPSPSTPENPLPHHGMLLQGSLCRLADFKQEYRKIKSQSHREVSHLLIQQSTANKAATKMDLFQSCIGV